MKDVNYRGNGEDDLVIGSFKMGDTIITSDDFPGYIADVRIYNKKLTDAERNIIMRETTSFSTALEVQNNGIGTLTALADTEKIFLLNNKNKNNFGYFVHNIFEDHAAVGSKSYYMFISKILDTGEVIYPIGRNEFINNFKVNDEIYISNDLFQYKFIIEQANYDLFDLATYGSLSTPTRTYTCSANAEAGDTFFQIKMDITTLMNAIAMDDKLYNENGIFLGSVKDYETVDSANTRIYLNENLQVYLANTSKIYLKTSQVKLKDDFEYVDLLTNIKIYIAFN